MDFVYKEKWEDAMVGLPGRVRDEVRVAIIEYGVRGSLPQLRAQARTAFDFVKQDIDHDRQEAERKRLLGEKRREAARQRWQKHKTQQEGCDEDFAYAKPMQKNNLHIQKNTNEKFVYTKVIQKPSRVVDNNNLSGDNNLSCDNININLPDKETEKKETPKGGKKEKSPAAKLDSRRKAFYDSLVPYVEIYGKETVRAFYDYWSEPNKSCTRMRYELERTWDLARRIARWAANDKQFNPKQNGTDNSRTTPEERQQDAASIVARLLGEEEE